MAVAHKTLMNALKAKSRTPALPGRIRRSAQHGHSLLKGF